MVPIEFHSLGVHLVNLQAPTVRRRGMVLDTDRLISDTQDGPIALRCLPPEYTVGIHKLCDVYDVFHLDHITCRCLPAVRHIFRQFVCLKTDLAPPILDVVRLSRQLTCRSREREHGQVPIVSTDFLPVHEIALIALGILLHVPLDS